MMLVKRQQVGSTAQSPTELPSSLNEPRKNRPGSRLEVTPDSIIASSNFQKMSDGQLFAEIIDRYQAHDLWGFELRARAYLGKFSHGDRRDEIYYMKGLMELGEKNYGEALAQFNRVLRDHPNGKKAPAALFAKGVTFKKMNLIREAKLALTEVQNRFPGSPESMRASAELKVIK